MDCGMYQGRRKESAQKNRVMPVDPGIITNVVLSHAHIDHSGRIPVLTKANFSGRIFCTRATRDASEHLLADSAHIQESDAEYLNYKTLRSALSRMKNDSGKKSKKEYEKAIKKLKKNGHRIDAEQVNRLMQKYRLDGIEPLYTQEDAEQALTCFAGQPYRQPVTIGDKITCTFYDAGHILGSAISVIRQEKNGRKKTVCYSGDLGRFDKPILKDPTLDFAPQDRDIDLLIMESTYGDRVHEPVVDLKPALSKTVTETVERGGSILIPAFAYGRTQELLYFLHELYQAGEIPRIPVYVDSPLATKITKVFGEHPEVYDRAAHKTFLEQGKNPFAMPQLKFTESVEESMALNRDETSHIVLSASGMCEAGRILHHLRYKIHNPVHTILVVGFMAQHTLGRRILDLGQAYAEKERKGDAPLVKILNKEYPLKARVKKIGGFSAHGDRHEMLRFLKESNLTIKKIAVVHGEEEQSEAFAEFLRENGYDAVVPQEGETLSVL